MIQLFPGALRNLPNIFLHSQTLTLHNYLLEPICAVQLSSFIFEATLP